MPFRGAGPWKRVSVGLTDTRRPSVGLAAVSLVGFAAVSLVGLAAVFLVGLAAVSLVGLAAVSLVGLAAVFLAVGVDHVQHVRARPKVVVRVQVGRKLGARVLVEQDPRVLRALRARAGSAPIPGGAAGSSM